jgi:granule-bound starch synthase
MHNSITTFHLVLDVSKHEKCLKQVPIVSSTGGLVDTVKEGYTGFHAEAFNVEVRT